MPTTLTKDNTKIQLKTKTSSAEDKSLSDIALDVGEPLVNTNDKTLVIGDKDTNGYAGGYGSKTIVLGDSKNEIATVNKIGDDDVTNTVKLVHKDSGLLRSTHYVSTKNARLSYGSNILEIDADYDLSTLAETNCAKISLKDALGAEHSTVTITGSGATKVMSDGSGSITVNSEQTLTATQKEGAGSNASEIKLSGDTTDNVVTILGGSSTNVTTTADNIITISDTASSDYSEITADQSTTNLEYITEVTQSGGKIYAKKKTLQGTADNISITTNAAGETTVKDIAAYSDNPVDNEYVSTVSQSDGKISVARRTILKEDTESEDANDASTKTENGDVVVITSAVPPTGDDGIILKNRNIKGDKGIEVIVGNSTSDITVQHTHTDITAKTSYSEISTDDNAQVNIVTPKYDAQGHVTGTVDQKLTVGAATRTKLGTVKAGYTDSGANIKLNVETDGDAYVTLTETAISAAGGLTGITAGSGLSADIASGSGTLSVNVGPGLIIPSEGDHQDKVMLSTSGVIAGTYGSCTDTSPDFGETVTIPQHSVDVYGRVTSVSNQSIMLPSNISSTNITASLTDEKSVNSKWPVLYRYDAENKVNRLVTDTGIQISSTEIDVSKNVYPTANSLYDIGTLGNRFKEISGHTIYGHVFRDAGKDEQGEDLIASFVGDGSSLVNLCMSNVTGLSDALNGKAASSHGTHVPTPETADNAKFLRNDNKWATVTPANIGAAAFSHGTHVTFDTTNTPKAAGTAALGSASTVARSDHVHPAQTSVSGNAGTATKLATARTISLTGDVTGSTTFDGSADVSIVATVVNDSHSHSDYAPLSNPIFTGTVTAESFNAKSDARLKENFEPLAVKRSILDLPTYKFDFINGPKNQIGCKAQDLQEICPEIVDENSAGYLSIQESKIVYLLLEEVKKLKAEINDLKSKVINNE